jgi:hypothetical protein
MPTVPATVWPFAGDVTLADGAFFTVTVTVDDVAVPPSASVAVVVMVCVDPLLSAAVSQLNVCGELLPDATTDPSMLIDKLDRVVPLAEAPAALMLTVPATVAPFAGEETAAVGAFFTVTVIVDDVAVPPSASVAVVVMVCVDPLLRAVVSQLNVCGELLPDAT